MHARAHSPSAQRSVCWILPDIGHYHHARIMGYAQQGQGSVLVVEVGDQSGFREFKCQEPERRPYQTRRLFPGRSFLDLSAGEVRTALFRLLDEVRPDAVCVQGWSHVYALAGLAWCRRTGVPAVITSESQFSDFPRSFWKEAVKRRLIGMGQAGLVGGAPHVDYLVRLGMPRACIFDGYDVVDNDHFERGSRQARAEGAAARRRLGLPDRYFLASNRFIAKKNLPRLFQAYHRYLKACPDGWNLVLLGDGELRPDLERLRDELGLGGRITMPGFKGYQELPAYYGLAGAFVHASVSEQWGLVVNEAMAAGLPVLVSQPCGCSADLVRDGENGFVFDPLDVAELAQIMGRVAGECDLEAMGRASQRIIGSWTPETFGRNLARALAAALESPRRRDRMLDRAILWWLTR